MINLIICGVTSLRIYKPSLCGAVLRTLKIFLIYCGINLFGLLFTLVREPFSTFITISYQQVQDIVPHGGQNVTSQLAELRGNLSQRMGRAFG